MKRILASIAASLVPGITFGILLAAFLKSPFAPLVEQMSVFNGLLPHSTTVTSLLAVAAVALVALAWTRFRGWMTFLSGYEFVTALFSPVLGVPAAVIGALAALVARAVAGGTLAAALTVDWHSLLDFALLGYLAGTILGGARLAYWASEGFKLIKTPGYYAPYPSRFERVLYVWLCRQILNISLGPVTVYHADKAKFEGRMILGGNHQSGLDFLIARVAVPFSFRQITQVKQLSHFGGIFGTLGALFGAFGVESAGGKNIVGSVSVIDACANMLAKNLYAKLLIYAQGKLVYDNVQRHEDYRTGAIRIMENVVKQTGDTRIALVPMATHYVSECANPSLTRRFFAWLWSATGYGARPMYRAVVVVGEPISYDYLMDPATTWTDPATGVAEPIVPVDTRRVDAATGSIDPKSGELDSRRAINLYCDRVDALLTEAKSLAKATA